MTYLTRQQTAERLGVSLRTLDGLIGRGELPAYRVGSRLVRIRDTDVDAYLSDRLVAPAPRKEKPRPQRPCRYVPGMKVV